MLKKIAFAFLCFLMFLPLSAQDFSKFLEPLAAQYDLNKDDMKSYRISHSYFREATQMQHVYLQQTVNEIPIYNALFQLHIHNGEELKFHNCSFVKDAESRADAFTATLTVDQSFAFVLNQMNIAVEPCAEFVASSKGGVILVCADLFLHPVRAKLIYYPDADGVLYLAYEFAFEPLKTADSWTFVVSAVDGKILLQQNRTLSCQFDHSDANNNCRHMHSSTISQFQTRNLGQAVYNAYPLSIESPIHGPRALLNSEEYPEASPFGWHDMNGAPGAEYTITRGNNVYAHEDTLDINQPGYAPDGGPDLIFDFPYFEGDDPVLSLDASITNLFVWNNFLHDISFFYGFDEVSGNFQEMNYTGLGDGQDFVFAHALDGSGNNNANFGTPEEGFNPVMQMYIWNHLVGSLLEVVEPEVIADEYVTGASTFGVAPPVNPIFAEVILVNDGSANPTLGCSTLVNGAELAGKIAYFDRGSCTFVQKVQNAQANGAVAVIIANNQQGGAMSMGGNDNGTLSIPVLSISQADGALIKDQLLAGTMVNANFGGEYELLTFDSSFDNGIIAHEYGHGISNRLTGGPYQVNCLWNDEQMGEGWSDFFALIVSDTLGSASANPRGIGNFASNRPADAYGIRPFPYTTDMSINPLTYQNIQNLSIPHGVGSVWCTMLWDLYWAFVDEYGHSYDLYNNSGGNNMAIRLVVEGMRIQACNPGFVDGRDAILAADDYLYDGANQCLIWESFARRGLGFSASQGSSDVVGDETEAFNLPGFCTDEGVGIAAFNSQQFWIYPNPGNSYVYIKSSSSSNIVQVRVMDLSGALVQSVELNDTQMLFDVSSWSNGLYVIEVRGNQGLEYFKWVKN